jgi:DNA-binding MarR family transcriptional regulator
MTDDQHLIELKESVQHVEELLGVITRKMLGADLEQLLKNKHYRYLYEHTGKVPVKELAKKTGLSTATISRTWQRWEQVGLLVKDGKQFKTVFR